jgi:hypothetical protein
MTSVEPMAEEFGRASKGGALHNQERRKKPAEKAVVKPHS